MKQYRSLLSAMFAFLVLFSGSNIMVGLHICGGKIQNIALFSKADVCEMEKQMPPCHRQESKCCDDETIVHNSQDFSSPVTTVSFAPALALDVVLPPILISEVVPSSPVSGTRFFNYDPPLRATDKTVSLHTFLI